MTGGPDWEELTRLGLYHADSPHAEQRRELLAAYFERGITIDAMVEANDAGRLTSLLGDLGIRPDRDQWTLAQVAERSGMDRDTTARAFRAAGLTDVPDDLAAFGDTDVALMEGFALASSLFGTEAVLHFVRSMGMASSRVAVAAIHLANANYTGVLHRDGATELELSVANEFATVAMDTIPSVMETIFRHHVETELRRSVVSTVTPGSPTATLAVGFLDLVGFTGASAELGADELAAAITDFESIAGDIVTAHRARLVKVIGDEAMFATHEPDAAGRVALEIRAAVDAHPVLTAVRGGITYGPVVTLEGDYYGSGVNLAARAVAAAEPGDVLVNAALAAAAPDLATESIGDQMLKGFADPVELFRLLP